MPLTPDNTRSKNQSTWLGCLLLFSFLIYSNTLLNGFVYDDHLQIERNPYLESVSSIGKILTKPVWSFRGGEGAPNFYRPAMMLIYLFCHALFGTSPVGYHLVQILLHVAVVWLVFKTANQLLCDFWSAFAAAAIFAVHPIHTESIAWLAGITDIELSAFFLAAFLFFLKLGDEVPEKTWRLQLYMLASFAVALLSKEVAVTLPVLATLFEHFYRADRLETSLRRKLGRYAGFWILTAVYFGVRFEVFGGILSKRFHADVTLWQAVLSGVSLTGQYIGHFFWPWPLSFYYPFQKSVSPFEPPVLFGVLSLCVFGALSFWLWRKNRILSFSIPWIFITLSLVLNARWMPGTVFAERYWYLPSVGMCWLLGAAVVAVVRSQNVPQPMLRWSAAVLLLMLALLSAAGTVARNRDWKSDYTLCVQTLQVRPRAAHFHVNLGDMDWQMGKHDQAMAEWREALAEEPREPFALRSLGRALLEQEHYAEAESSLRESIRLAPQYSEPHVYLGLLDEKLGKNADAEGELRQAVELNPFGSDPRNALGRFYFERGRYAEAEEQFRASLMGVPSIDAYRGLGQACAKLAKESDAEDAWREALRREPFDELAHAGLGKIHMEHGRWNDAEREYRAVLLMDPKNPEALEALEKIKKASNGNAQP